MRKILVAISSCAIVLLAACSDRGTTAPDIRGTPRFNLDPNAIPCEDISPNEITGLIEAVFGAGSPDANAALGKWGNIQKQKLAGNSAVVVDKTWDLINFIVTKQQQNKLPANADSERLGRALFCFAGINATLPRTLNAWVVYSSDADRILVTDDGFAGVKLSGRNVQETSLISIVEAVDTLRTNLDKYPKVYEFSKYPSNVFVEPVTAAVCGAIPLEVPNDVLTRLVLGHNTGASGFELLNRVSIDFLNCAPLATGAAKQSIGHKLLAMLLPANLYALGPGASGIGGTLLEFSPIGPVDPRINVTPNAAGTSAPIGSLVLPPPSVTLTTPRGKTLSAIPVNFAVTGGEGTIAPLTASTDANGTSASVSWRLGLATGTNSATATPATGASDAVPGVLFTPAVTTFTAQATAATGIEISGGPVAGTSYTAGTTLPSATIRVVGENNRTVEGYSGPIGVGAVQGGPLFGTASQTAVLGQATFSDLSIQTAGASQQLRFAAGALAANSGVFAIGAAAASTLIISGGNGQSGPVGTVLGVAAGTTAPTVLVSDAYGNAVSGATVYFTPATAQTVTQATNATGNASTTWTLQAGANELLASLDELPTLDESRFKVFTATGTTAASATILSCAPDNQKDPINAYAVRVDGNNKRITDAAFHLSVGGAASALTPYLMRVTARVYGTVQGVQNTLISTIPSTDRLVYLRGSNNEQKEANFVFPGGFTSGNNTRIVFTIAPAPSQTFTRTINFNTGGCAPGTKCTTPPTACRSVLQVPITTPLGTAYRLAPAVRLTGF